MSTNELPKGTVISKEVAEQEVEKWLSAKRIGFNKRETYKKHIADLVGYVQEGVLKVNDKNEFVHTLKFPTESEKPTKELTYKLRLSVDEVVNGIKGTPPAEIMLAYMFMLTGIVPGVAKKFDSEDWDVCQSIGIFFL